MVKMNRASVAKQLLLSHQFSFGINGGVQQVIMACTITLEINPTWVMMDLDSENARTFCSWDKLEGELELNVVYHSMLTSYKDLYGKNVIVQWHFGNGRDSHPTSFQMSCEGLRQGDAPALVSFNVLIARVYRKQIVLLAGRGVLFAMADDVKIMAPPAVITELAEGFPALVWHEAGLKTQNIKSRIYGLSNPLSKQGGNFSCARPHATPHPISRYTIYRMGASYVTRRTLLAGGRGRWMMGSIFSEPLWDPRFLNKNI